MVSFAKVLGTESSGSALFSRPLECVNFLCSRATICCWDNFPSKKKWTDLCDWIL